MIGRHLERVNGSSATVSASSSASRDHQWLRWKAEPWAWPPWRSACAPATWWSCRAAWLHRPPAREWHPLKILPNPFLAPPFPFPPLLESDHKTTTNLLNAGSNLQICVWRWSSYLGRVINYHTSRPVGLSASLRRCFTTTPAKFMTFFISVTEVLSSSGCGWPHQ